VQEKALVMEVNEDLNRVILLTRDGQFISRRLSGVCPQIGEEISIGEERNKKGLWYAVSILVAAAMFFVTFFAGGLWNKLIIPSFGNSVVAYVTVDINPSVELGLDNENIVVTVRPLNEDAKILLQGIVLKGHTSEEAVDVFVDAAAQKGYLAPEKKNQVIINVSKKEPAESDDHQVSQIIAEHAKKTLEKQNVNAKIEVINTDFEVRDKAEEVNLSAGKYAILVEAKEAGLDINVKSIQKFGVIKAIEKAGGNPEEIIKYAKEEKDFSKKINKWQQDLKTKQQEIKANNELTKEEKKNVRNALKEINKLWKEQLKEKNNNDIKEKLGEKSKQKNNKKQSIEQKEIKEKPDSVNKLDRNKIINDKNKQDKEKDKVKQKDKEKEKDNSKGNNKERDNNKNTVKDKGEGKEKDIGKLKNRDWEKDRDKDQDRKNYQETEKDKNEDKKIDNDRDQNQEKHRTSFLILRKLFVGNG
jgi:hypothetical protein